MSAVTSGTRNAAIGLESRNVDHMSSHLARDHTICIRGRKEGKKEVFYLMTHSTHFIYSYMTSDIW